MKEEREEIEERSPSYVNLPPEIKYQLYAKLSDQEKFAQAEVQKSYSLELPDIAENIYTFTIVRLETRWKVTKVLYPEEVAKAPKRRGRATQFFTPTEATKINDMQNAFAYNVVRMIMSFIYPEQTVPPLRELIQNSVDARANRIYVNMKVESIKTKEWSDECVTEVLVDDNGEGMSKLNVTGDLLIPTISSKRTSLFYEPSMAVSRETYEKVGVFGLGFFSFLAIMNKVYVLTRMNAGKKEYYFACINVPDFLKTINKPNFEAMILPIPDTTQDIEEYIDNYIESAKNTQSRNNREVFDQERDIIVELWTKFNQRVQGTIVLGREPNYEEKDRVLREPALLEKVVRYLGDFLKLRRPEINLYLNGDLMTLSTQLREFTKDEPLIIEGVQSVKYKGHLEPVDRKIIVWCQEFSFLPHFTILTGSIPIEFNFTKGGNDTDEVTGLTGAKLSAISAMCPEFSSDAKAFQLRLSMGLAYHFIVDCNYIDLNIGRDKILENENYDFFNQQFAEAILRYNDQVFPSGEFLKFKEAQAKKKEESPTALFWSRLEAYYFWNTRYLGNTKFDDLVRKRMDDLRIFDLYFQPRGFIGSHSVNSLLEGGYETIYLIPRDAYIDKDLEKMLKEIDQVGGVAIIKLPPEFLTSLMLLNAFAPEFAKKGMEILYLDPRNSNKIDFPHNNLTLLMKVVHEVKQTEFVDKTLKPEKVLEQTDPEITQIDINIILKCEELVAFIIDKFQTFYTKVIREALGLFSLWGILKSDSELAMTPEERKTVSRFFNDPHSVKMVKLAKALKAVAVWYEGKMVGSEWQAGWIGINKDSSAYVEMLKEGIYEQPLELIAYLSTLIAHELAHSDALEILSKYLLGEQSKVHYGIPFVNTREITQDFAGEYLAKQIKKERKVRAKSSPVPSPTPKPAPPTSSIPEEDIATSLTLALAKADDPFYDEEFFCAKCQTKMEYLGNLIWHCPTCNIDKEIPPKFLLKTLYLRAKKYLKQSTSQRRD